MSEEQALPELERECSQCEGSGRGDSGWQCGLCYGTGYELTDAGEQVLDLVKHQFKRLLKANIG